MARDLSHLSDDDLLKIAVKSKDLSHLSDDDLAKIASKAPASSDSPLMTAGRSAADMAAAGYLPQLTAGVGAGLMKAGLLEDPMSKIVYPKGYTGDRSKTDYTTLRDDTIAEQQASEAKNPLSAIAGKIGGAVATAPLLAGEAAQGAGILGRSLQAAKVGAIQGAIQNPGDTKGEVNPLQLPERLQNAKEGAEFGVGGQLAGEAIGATAKGLASKEGSIVSKVGNALTGVPKKDIETFTKRPEEIQSLASKYGEDIQSAVDDTRSSINKQIQTTKQALNDKIKSGIESKGLVLTDANPIKEKLIQAKNALNKNTKADDIAQIDEMLGTLKNMTNEDGTILASDAFDFYDYAKNLAKGAYVKNGQIFQTTDAAKRAAKDATRVARQMVSQEIPEASQALTKLSQLHTADEIAGKSLLKEGAPVGQMLTAGSGSSRQRKALGLLQEITGSPLVEKAENMSALRSLGTPSYLPVDPNGKSMARIAIGGGLGLLGGGYPGVAAGAVATSPAVMKAGLLAKNAIGKTGAVQAATNAGNNPGIIGALAGKVAAARNKK